MKNTHGGPGRNQGRKKIAPEKKKQTYATRLNPETIKKIRSYHIPGSQLIEKAIDFWIDKEYGKH